MKPVYRLSEFAPRRMPICIHPWLLFLTLYFTFDIFKRIVYSYKLIFIMPMSGRETFFLPPMTQTEYAIAPPPCWRVVDQSGSLTESENEVVAMCTCTAVSGSSVAHTKMACMSMQDPANQIKDNNLKFNLIKCHNF